MRYFPSLALISALALPARAQGIVNNEAGPAGPNPFFTKAPIVLVDATGKTTKIDAMAVQPKSGSKLFSYTWKYVLTGPDAEVTVITPTKILLGKVNVREVTSGYHLVKVQRDGNNRKWAMKQGSDGFYPDKEAQVFKPEEHPTPKKAEDGTYSISFPKPLPAGSYLLQTATEGWDFEVK